MKNLFLILIAILSVTSIAKAETDVGRPRIVQKIILACNEEVTGADVSFRVTNIYSSIVFPGGSSSGGVTERIISGQYVGLKFLSTFKSAKLADEMTWDDASKFKFLSEASQNATGAEYDFQNTFYDKKHQYPGELLRLRVEVVSPKKDQFGFTTTHINLNILMPESRAQSAKGFTGYGYVSSSIDNRNDELGGGLAQFVCKRTYKIL